MNYYDEKQFLAAVDENDIVVGTVEKWEAHKKGILHRGYTVIITYGKQIALQHRKHPVFDDVFDLSFSSHQIYKGDRLQGNEEAIYEGLLREWGIGKSGIAAPPRFLKKISYQAKDQKSEYIEHEIDYLFEVEAVQSPAAREEYAYGGKLVDKDAILKGSLRLPSPWAPWVKTLLAEGVI